MRWLWGIQLEGCSGPASDEDSLGYYVAIELTMNKQFNTEESALFWGQFVLIPMVSKQNLSSKLLCYLYTYVSVDMYQHSQKHQIQEAVERVNDFKK